LIGVPYVAAGTNMRMMQPRLLVIHYTATMTARGTVAGFTMKGAGASAHLVIDRDGSITQTVPFDRTAAHAGNSAWKSVEGCNRFSVGFELVNMGPLSRDGAGHLRDWYKRPMPLGTEAVEAVAPGGNLWEAYPEAQYLATDAAAKAVCERYGITEIVGHYDVATPKGRKIDPGPAFPMARLRAAVLGG
jgi:N-acetylmuramoyl-L-alanine amidase